MAIGNLTAWNAEFTPPTVRAIGQAVVDRFDAITWSHIGFKGNDAHDGGYHRSLSWCMRSLGIGADYSDRISRDISQRDHPTRRNAIRAFDITAPAEILIPMCSRLDWAMRHGLVDDVREWFGNDDGDQRVDGYDNFFDRVVSSDSSHLWHLHGSLYTDTVDGPHDRLIAVLLGTPGWDDLEDDMDEEQNNRLTATTYRDHGILTMKPVVSYPVTRSGKTTTVQEPNELAKTLGLIVQQGARDEVRDAGLAAAVASLTELVRAGGGDVDTAAILARVDEQAERTVTAVATLQQRLAEVSGQLDAAQAENLALRERLVAAYASQQS